MTMKNGKMKGLVLWGLSLCMASPQVLFAAQFSRMGNAFDLQTKNSQVICLAGGGSDDDWAEGWRFFLESAQGGDVVIIKANSSSDAYNSWIYNDEEHHGFPKINSVTTLSLSRRADAESPRVEALIENAEVVFFGGGDQSKYIDWMTNTRLSRAIDRGLKMRQLSLGGTSAGMAILGSIDFAAHLDSPLSVGGMVTGQDVLNNPAAPFVDLNYDFITAPFLNHLVTETHFSSRQREGRVVGFMAKAFAHFGGKVALSDIKAIASDEDTSLCFNSQGQAHAYGMGNVFFLRGNKAIENYQEGSPLVWDANSQAIKTQIISGKNPEETFDLQQWQNTGGYSEYWWVEATSNPLREVKRKRSSDF